MQRQVLKHGFSGGRCALGRLLDDRDFQFFIKDFAELFGRAEIEFLARFLERFFFQLHHALGEKSALLFEHVRVHVGAVALDAAEHRHQRHFDVVEHAFQTRFFFQARPQGLVQAQGDVRVFGGVGAGFIEPDLVKGELLDALAGDLLEADVFVAQIFQRQGVHIVAGGHGVEHVGFQHGVVFHAAQGDAGAGQYAHVVLEVLADFFALFVFENGLELVQYQSAVELIRRARIVVAEGYVGGVACGGGEADAHQVRFHVIEAGGFGVESEQLGFLKFVEPGVQFFLGKHGLVAVPVDALFALDVRSALYRRVIAFQQFIEPAFEFQIAVVTGQLFRVGRQQFEVVQGFLEFAVHLDGGQLVGEKRLLAVFFQFLAHGLGAAEIQLGDLVQVVVNLFQRTQTGEQRQGGLFADPGDTGNVVHLVAHQRQEIDNQLRADTEFFAHAVDVVDGVVHGVDQGDVVVDQLCHVLVAGGDQHRLLFGAENAREGADHVVGFDAVLDDQRQAHGADQIVQRLHLLAQLVGHRRPVGLVLLEQLVAEGFALGVEHHRHVLGVVVVDHLAQHRGDAAHRAGGLAGGGGQRRQRVEGPVQVGGAVDKDDRFTLGHGSPWGWIRHGAHSVTQDLAGAPCGSGPAPTGSAVRGAL